MARHCACCVLAGALLGVLALIQFTDVAEREVRHLRT